MTLVLNWYEYSREGESQTLKTAPLLHSARWAVLLKSLLGTRLQEDRATRADTAGEGRDN